MSDQNSQQNKSRLQTTPSTEGLGGDDIRITPCSEKPAKMPVSRDAKPITRREEPPNVPVAQPKQPKDSK